MKPKHYKAGYLMQAQGSDRTLKCVSTAPWQVHITCFGSENAGNRTRGQHRNQCTTQSSGKLREVGTWPHKPSMGLPSLQVHFSVTIVFNKKKKCKNTATREKNSVLLCTIISLKFFNPRLSSEIFWSIKNKPFLFSNKEQVLLLIRASTYPHNHCTIS